MENDLYAMIYYPETPSQAVFRITAIQRLPNGHTILLGVGAPNYTYSVQASPDLVIPFSVIPAATPSSDPLGNLQYEDANTASKRFYRFSYP